MSELKTLDDEFSPDPELDKLLSNYADKLNAMTAAERSEHFIKAASAHFFKMVELKAPPILIEHAKRILQSRVARMVTYCPEYESHNMPKIGEDS
jgi:hypothetical protein